MTLLLLRHCVTLSFGHSLFGKFGKNFDEEIYSWSYFDFSPFPYGYTLVLGKTEPRRVDRIVKLVQTVGPVRLFVQDKKFTLKPGILFSWHAGVQHCCVYTSSVTSIFMIWTVQLQYVFHIFSILFWVWYVDNRPQFICYHFPGMWTFICGFAWMVNHEYTLVVMCHNFKVSFLGLFCIQTHRMDVSWPVFLGKEWFI